MQSWHQYVYVKEVVNKAFCSAGIAIILTRQDMVQPRLLHAELASVCVCEGGSQQSFLFCWNRYNSETTRHAQDSKLKSTMHMYVISI